MASKFLILGAGRQARATAAFLLESFPDTRVIFLDCDATQIEEALELQRHKNRVETWVADIQTPSFQIKTFAEDVKCVISCVPFYFNYTLASECISHSLNFCDMGGNTAIVRQQMELNEQAVDAGSCIVPDCGLAPGLANILAEHWNHIEYQSVEIRCGGLPVAPGDNILKYQLCFNTSGLLNEYFEPCEISQNGHLVKVPGLSGHQRTKLFDIELEEFYTSGGTSLAAEEYADQGIDYCYKTLRYPGHRDAFMAMREAGFFRTDISVNHEMCNCTPYRVSREVIDSTLPQCTEDFVILSIDVADKDGKKHSLSILEHSDDRFLAMERLTGFSTAIVAAYVSGLYGTFPTCGCYPPYRIIPSHLIVEKLIKQGVSFCFT